MYQGRINELSQSLSDSTFHLQFLEIDQIKLEVLYLVAFSQSPFFFITTNHDVPYLQERVASLNYEVSELGRCVQRPLRLRIAADAKVHASRGSLKAGDAREFPELDYKNSLPITHGLQGSISYCCVVS